MSKRKKKFMQTSKKALISFLLWCATVQVLCLYFAFRFQSEMIMSIFAGTVVVEPAAIYKFYLDYQKEINLFHMEKNYIPDYDERQG